MAEKDWFRDIIAAEKQASSGPGNISRTNKRYNAPPHFQAQVLSFLGKGQCNHLAILVKKPGLAE